MITWWLQETQMARAHPVPLPLGQALVESYAVNDPAAWRAKLPGSRGRTIADIFSHLHNMRRKWLRLSAPHLKLTAPLDRVRCSQQQAGRALAESAARCSEMLAEALVQPEGRVKAFRRDGWAKPWPVGAAPVGALPLPVKAGAGMWVWEKLWKDCGFTHPR
jgi:hypothetical protein